MPSKKAVLSRLFLSCLLRVCCSGQLHVDLMIIFCYHADQRHRCGLKLLVAFDAYPQEHVALLLKKARLLSCICTRKMVPLLFRTPQHDTSTCHVPFCLWIHLCSSSGTDTAHTQRMVFTQGCLLSYNNALEESVVASFAPQLLAACMLLRAVHVHLVIIPR